MQRKPDGAVVARIISEPLKELADNPDANSVKPPQMEAVGAGDMWPEVTSQFVCEHTSSDAVRLVAKPAGIPTSEVLKAPQDLDAL